MAEVSPALPHPPAMDTKPQPQQQQQENQIHTNLEQNLQSQSQSQSQSQGANSSSSNGNGGASISESAPTATPSSSSAQQQSQPFTPPPPMPMAPPSVTPVPFYRPFNNSNMPPGPPGLAPPGVAPSHPPGVAPSHPPGVGMGSAPNPNSPLVGFGGPPGVAPPHPGMRPPGVFSPGLHRPFAGPPGTPQPPQMMNPGVPGTAPTGHPRYQMTYPGMVRPGFHPRPPGAMGMMPLPRPPIPGVRPPVTKFPPMTLPDTAAQGAVPIITSSEKPQTTVYVGKIASTVDNEFILSILELCGPIKSWKRAQDPTNGTLSRFGFCEFETAEGVLRGLRLLNRYSLEGSELVLNVTQSTRDYLERYVEKKKEEKQCKGKPHDADKDDDTAPGVEKIEPQKLSATITEKKDADDTDDQADNAKTFGIVDEADQEADELALKKLTLIMEERLKNRPLPPPPKIFLKSDADAAGKSVSTSEAAAKSKDADSDVEIVKSDGGDEKLEDDTMSENKPPSEHERAEANSIDRGRRHAHSRDRERESRERDRESRDRDRGRDQKRDKEWELERIERERERERLWREREREKQERLYDEREKEWVTREKEKERLRQNERDREKERERERQRLIKEEQEESDDENRRKRYHRSNLIEEKRRRQREKEDDLYDRRREEEEIAEARKKKHEDKENYELQKTITSTESHVQEAVDNGIAEKADEEFNLLDHNYGADALEPSHQAISLLPRDGNLRLSKDDVAMEKIPIPESRQNSGLPARKLGFGIINSGKRAVVPSVFVQEDDEDAHKNKKMRPLVPIDYSSEEMQIVSATDLKEDRHEYERERNKKSGDKHGHKERESNLYDGNRGRDRDRDRSHHSHHDREDSMEKAKALENKKLLDAKQLIDTIPKTKEALFAYHINWDLYDKNDLHERMRPWISKKITEFLGEEEKTLVDFVVTKTKNHVTASQMLELLESILDEEAEMFVLKMWRMLIFEIKKVETGISSKSKT